MTTKDLIKIIRKIERDNKTENLEIGELRLENGNFYPFKSVELTELATGQKIIELSTY